MNREEFILYLKNPASLDKKSLPEINELIEDFPFFQSGHLLFLKNLHNLDHIRFGSQLKKSSSIVADRERLYELLFPATGLGTEFPVERKKEVEDTGVIPVETGTTPFVEKAEKENLPEEFPKSDSPGNLGEEKKVKQEVTNKTSPIKKDIDSGEPGSADNLREQVERRLAEIRGEVFTEVKTEEPEEETKQGKETSEDTEKHAEDQNEYHNIVKDKESGQEEGLSEAGELLLLGDEKEVDVLYGDPEQLPGEDPEDVLYKEESLLDLDYPIDNEDAGNEEKSTGNYQGEETTSSFKVEMESKIESEDIEDKADLKGEIHSFESWLSMLRTTMPSEGGKENLSQGVKKPVLSQREIIDKFILENPRIQPNHDDNDEKEDMSAESIDDKDGLFTETLANIYVKQEYYSKAIFFYQELSLKFPEKSIYFARRIKEIEKRINKL